MPRPSGTVMKRSGRWPVIAAGRAAGEATVVVHSPRLERNIGYAMLGREHAALGTPLIVETPWGTVPARVAPRPFIPPIRALRDS